MSDTRPWPGGWYEHVGNPHELDTWWQRRWNSNMVVRGKHREIRSGDTIRPAGWTVEVYTPSYESHGPYPDLETAKAVYEWVMTGRQPLASIAAMIVAAKMIKAIGR